MNKYNTAMKCAFHLIININEIKINLPIYIANFHGR